MRESGVEMMVILGDGVELSLVSLFFNWWGVVVIVVVGGCWGRLIFLLFEWLDL